VVIARVAEIIARLEALAPRVQAEAEAADRLARLPEDVMRELKAMRAFRLWIPERYGGLELELPETLRIYEAAARIDGSVGWAVMIGAGGGLFAACLEPDTAREIFAPADALIAGSGAPDGVAEQAAGGYRVNGTWRYASGAHDATTLTANCTVTRGGEPLRGTDGSPVIRAMAFTPAQVAIRESWDASGMRATGSHDFEVRDAWVPGRRSFTVHAEVVREPGPLYRLPFEVLTELPVAAVAVGIARHALDAFAALHALARRAWDAAVADRALGARERAEITATCVTCVSDLLAAVGALLRPAGMAAIAREGELARAFRDLQALAAHASVAPRQLAPAGRALLGGWP